MMLIDAEWWLLIKQEPHDRSVFFVYIYIYNVDLLKYQLDPKSMYISFIYSGFCVEPGWGRAAIILFNSIQPCKDPA